MYLCNTPSGGERALENTGNSAVQLCRSPQSECIEEKKVQATDTKAE